MTRHFPQTTAKILAGSLAFVFERGEEAIGLRRKLKNRVTTRCVSLLEHSGQWEDAPVVIAEAGGGLPRSERATHDLIVMRRPRWVIAAGFAASLQDQVERGHILMPDMISDLQGKTWPVGCQVDAEEVAARRTLHVGKLVTVPVLPQTEEEQSTLLESQQALACDTHSQAVAEVCRRQGVRFLAVRIIDRDPVHQLASDLAAVDGRPTTAGRLGAAARTLFQRPHSLQDMWQRRKTVKKLSHQLGHFLTGVIERLQQRDEQEERISPG